MLQAENLVAIGARQDYPNAGQTSPIGTLRLPSGCPGGRVLSAFISSLRTVDLRRKILFTLGVVILYRVGASLPSPGVNYKNIHQCIEQVSGGSGGQIYSLINLFSGGALLQLTVFAVGVMPYITASIIVQLLTVVIPRFEQLRKEGQAGQAKMTQYTRYLAIALAILQATSIVALAANGGLLQGCSLDILQSTSIFALIIIVLVMTAGAALVMWMGELVTERGVGNGMSLMIFAGIAARIPAEGKSILDSRGGMVFAAVCAAALVIIIGVVFVEQGQRRIPVQYAKRMVGRRMYGGTSTYLPLKVNQAGVIPVIFASSLIYIPHLITQLIQSGRTTPSNGWWDRFVANYLTNPADPVYIGTYFGLIIFFTYFYVSITFNPDERADEMKKFGGFIPGIRPGKPTADYLRYVLNRITLPGSIYLGVIAVLPNVFLQMGNSGGVQNLPFGGTAVLIMIGVGLDTVKQIESQLMQRNYEGFLK
jgi:preprotein translocase subunit SecY